MNINNSSWLWNNKGRGYWHHCGFHNDVILRWGHHRWFPKVYFPSSMSFIVLPTWYSELNFLSFNSLPITEKKSLLVSYRKHNPHIPVEVICSEIGIFMYGWKFVLKTPSCPTSKINAFYNNIMSYNWQILIVLWNLL